MYLWSRSAGSHGYNQRAVGLRCRGRHQSGLADLRSGSSLECGVQLGRNFPGNKVMNQLENDKQHNQTLWGSTFSWCAFPCVSSYGTSARPPAHRPPAEWTRRHTLRLPSPCELERTAEWTVKNTMQKTLNSRKKDWFFTNLDKKSFKSNVLTLLVGFFAFLKTFSQIIRIFLLIYKLVVFNANCSYFWVWVNMSLWLWHGTCTIHFS